MTPTPIRRAFLPTLAILVSCTSSFRTEHQQLKSPGVAARIARNFAMKRAFEDVRYFTQFWRIAGGPGFDSCVNYVGMNLELAGLAKARAEGASAESVGSYEILEDPPTGKAWIPEDAVLSMESPHRSSAVCHGWLEDKRECLGGWE